ncbi:hypothetical protein RUM43_013069 [Polyplax serrata]|uniref:Uncharacterized protein n=1 Tax=Polyplax serrata TaxID=468196 RepID=A0AAN8RZ51_POLSC
MGRRFCFPAREAGENAFQRVFKGLSEVSVEIGVYEWIQSRIEVANPEKYGDDNFRAVAGFSTKCRYDVPETVTTGTREQEGTLQWHRSSYAGDCTGFDCSKTVE